MDNQKEEKTTEQLNPIEYDESLEGLLVKYDFKPADVDKILSGVNSVYSVWSINIDDIPSQIEEIKKELSENQRSGTLFTVKGGRRDRGNFAIFTTLNSKQIRRYLKMATLI